MERDELIGRIQRLLQRAEKTGSLVRPEPRELVGEYFTNMGRPRLSCPAFLVWCYICHRADPESRIAAVSYREISSATGVRGHSNISRALEDLAYYRYLVLPTVIGGRGLPRNYKVPERIGLEDLPPHQASDLRMRADRPRKRGAKHKRIMREYEEYPAQRAVAEGAISAGPETMPPLADILAEPPGPAAPLADPVLSNITRGEG